VTLQAVKQAVYILVIATLLGLGVNLVSPNAVPYVGQWRELHEGVGPIIPPSAEPGDPLSIAVDSALLDFNSRSALFVDARDPEEFDCGTIPGAINVPFDYLPEGDLGAYLDSALQHAPKDTRIITFCSGEECDLSLHLARNLQSEGYTNLAIFFGGAREWEKFELPMERRRQCDD